jgi:hypothetical protein
MDKQFGGDLAIVPQVCFLMAGFPRRGHALLRRSPNKKLLPGEFNRRWRECRIFR